MKYTIINKRLIKKIVITNSKMFNILSKHKIYQLSLSFFISLFINFNKKNPCTLYSTCVDIPLPKRAIEDLCKTYHLGTQ